MKGVGSLFAGAVTETRNAAHELQSILRYMVVLVLDGVCDAHCLSRSQRPTPDGRLRPTGRPW